MKSQRFIVKITALTLIAAMAATMAGCRASDEIRKIVYTQDASDVDDTEFAREWSKQAEEPDDESQELQDEQEADKTEQEMEEEQTTNDPSVDESAPTEAEDDTANTDEAAQVAAADETGNNAVSNGSDDVTGQNATTGASGDTINNDSNAVNGTGSGGDATASSGSADGGDPGTDSGNEGEGAGDGGAEGSGDGEGSSTEAGDNSAGEDEREPRKQIYDADGNLIDLPDSVDTIVAAGEAALITQMLGGEGVLLASSSDFLSNSLVQSVFADEGIAGVETLWSGDGSAPMSDDSFARLLELDPDCVLTMSGEANFSTDQETQLKEAQIYIVALPALTSSDNICTAVETVGQVLDDHEVGDTTSVALAEEYVAYESDLVAEVQGKKGAYHIYMNSSDQARRAYFTNISNTISNGDFAMILYDWDDSFSFSYSYNGTTYVYQSGGAIVSRSYKWNPMSYYLAVAGVMNTATGSSTTEDYTVYVPFYTLGLASGLNDEDQNQDGLYVGRALGSLGIFSTSNIGYTASGGSEIYMGAYSASSGNYMITGYSMWAGLGITSQLNQSPWYVSGAYAWLGTNRFPYVIAANAEIATKLETEKANSGSLYAIRTWGIDVGSTIYVATYNPTTEQQQLVINYYTTQRQDYDIVVNPSGCGDWLTGSVESMLESVWISNLYYGDETYSDIAMEEKILEFYETFYRHSLSGSELNDILDGE